MSLLDQNISPSAADQARLELSLAAANTERTNRPRVFLVGAGLLLAIAVIYALTGVSARASALGSVAAARRQTSNVVELTTELRSLQKALDARGVEYNPQMPIFLEELARNNGAEPASAIREEPAGTSIANMQQKKYRATFVDQDPAHLLAFVNATQTSPLTSGIEISRIDLKPGNPNNPDPATGQLRWRMEVDFTRWERRR